MNGLNNCATNSNTITTSRIAISKSKMFMAMIGKFAKSVIVLSVLLATIGIAAGIIIDIRWLIVSLMIIFIVIPMLMLIIYFNYGLKPECFINILPHTISFSPSGIEVITYTTIDNENGNEPKTTERKYHFSKAEIKPYSTSANSLYIPIGKHDSGILIVPYSSFDSKDSLSTAVQYLLCNNKG